MFNGMLGDNKKKITAILAVGKAKNPEKFKKESNLFDDEESSEEVTPKDQKSVCAKQLIKAIKNDDVESFIKHFARLQEAISDNPEIDEEDEEEEELEE